MNKRLKLSCLSLFLALVICSCSSQKKYSYETVPNDPLKARIYTLDNGLKVYLTVNKETPRIQTFIAVRVGGKNDPAETTGLAHYFEHLMFKGTDKYGTQDYAAEKPLLDQIEQQFEIYRQTTDEAERKAIYHTIDSPTMVCIPLFLFMGGIASIGGFARRAGTALRRVTGRGGAVSGKRPAAGPAGGHPGHPHPGHGTGAHDPRQ